MRRFESRVDVTMCSAASAATSAFGSVERTQMRGPCSAVAARRHDRGAERVQAFEQTVVEAPDMRLDRGNAHLCDELHPCDPGIERRNRRSAAVESPRGRVR